MAAVNLKKLAIVTTAYTGFQLTDDRAGVEKYLSEKLGKPIAWSDIPEMKEEIRVAIKSEVLMMWGLGEIQQKEPVAIDDGMLRVELALEDTVLVKLRDYASRHGYSIENAIEEILTGFVEPVIEVQV